MNREELRRYTDRQLYWTEAIEIRRPNCDQIPILVSAAKTSL